MKLKVIAVDETQVGALLDEFKMYASVPVEPADSESDTLGPRDTMLMSFLRSALLRVQEYADVALVQTTYQLTTVVGEDHTVRLYPGGYVQEVTDEEGNAISGHYVSGDRIWLDARPGTVVKVTYTTQEVPELSDTPLAPPEDLARLKPTVFRYATALYDGETTEVLNGILNEALC